MRYNNRGCPPSLPMAYVGEILAPILIVLGLFTRPAALVYALTLVVAFLMVGTGKVFTVTDVGAWGIENELVFFMGGVVILLLGSGKYAIARNEAYR